MAVHTHRSHHEDGDQIRIADTLWKRSRLARREKRGGEPLGIAQAHPTKKLTAGRRKAGRPDSAKFTKLRAHLEALLRALWRRAQ